MAYSKKAKRDAYQEITDTMIAALEKETAPWLKPWNDKGTAHKLPVNGSTGKPYKGINILILWNAAQERNYTSNVWMTFDQASKKGYKVKPGKGTGVQIVFWKINQYDKKDGNGNVVVDENGYVEKNNIPMARFYTVFNADRIEGIEPSEAVEPIQAWEDMNAVESDIAALGADIRHGGDNAYYRPKDDFIQMPEKDQFENGGAYYATLLHEITHWTGNSKRLDRKGGSFGDADYAFEELVAEIGSAFLCTDYNITGTLQHPEYVKGWIKVLKNDKRAIVRAASKAQKAVEYIYENMENREAMAA